MKIQDKTSEEINKTSDSNKELNPAEKWLFDTEDGEVRLKALMNMSTGQQGIAELSEFKTYGSDAEKTFSMCKCEKNIRDEYRL